MGQGVLDPGELGLGAGREAVLPARVVGELVVAPVAFVERRVAEHGVDGQPRERVGAQCVAGPHGHRGGGVAVGAGAQGEAECAERSEIRVGVLRVQGVRAAHRAEQGPGAGGRVEDRTRGPPAGPHEGRHQFGEAGRCEGELARVGGELAAEQELEGLVGTGLTGEFGDRAQQRDGREQLLGGGGVNSTYRPVAVRVRGGRPETRREQAAEGGVQHIGHPCVGDGGDLQPRSGPVADQQQGAARVDQGGNSTGRVSGQLLPDPFPERHFGEFPLVAQPPFDLGQCEGGTGLGAAHRFGEVGVPATPVADGGAPHPREPGDSGRGHLCRVLRHWLSPWSGRVHVYPRRLLCRRAYRPHCARSIHSVHQSIPCERC